MTLLISETLTVDVVLDRAIRWSNDVYDDLASLAAEDDVLQEHEGRIASGPEPSWYDPRLPALRQAILSDV